MIQQLRSHTHRHRPNIALLAIVSALSLGSARSAAAQDEGIPLSAVATDSVLHALASSDRDERHQGLSRLLSAYPSRLPSAVVPAILSLLSAEPTSGADHEEDEEYGEYATALVIAGVRTGDPRAVEGIVRLDGLSMSSGIASFVASQGRSVMPLLDALARTREDRASDVLETYALMYARHGARLSRADSASVLRRLLAAASDTSVVVRAQLARVAPRGPIPELLPAIAFLLENDPERIEGVLVVRRDAARAVPVLQQARASLSTSGLLSRLALLTDAACEGADGRLAGQCTALNAYLATAARQLAAGEAKPAANALDAYRRAVQALADDGLLKRLTAVTLDGTAAAVAERL